MITFSFVCVVFFFFHFSCLDFSSFFVFFLRVDFSICPDPPNQPNTRPNTPTPNPTLQTRPITATRRRGTMDPDSVPSKTLVLESLSRNHRSDADEIPSNVSAPVLISADLCRISQLRCPRSGSMYWGWR